jgi:hypothetical protein
MPASLMLVVRNVLVCVMLCAGLSGAGCAASQTRSLTQALQPSNDRDWRPELAVLSTAKVKRERIEIHNIRNCSWISEDDMVVDHYDATFDWQELRGVDFLVVPFRDAPSLAHTMLSFDFGNAGHVVVSVEARMEKGETYSPLLGALGQYELMYVIGSEQDLIRLRTSVRDSDVYLYRTNASPEQSRKLLTHIMERANKLAKQPEFYDTVSNNCTTNLALHVNQIRPNRVPMADLRLLLPGYSDRLAYDLGLLDRDRPFEQLKQEAQINYLARVYHSDPEFSHRIRRR